MIVLPEFLKPLEVVTCPFPQAAVEEAITRRDESIPYLLDVLEWTLANAKEVPGNYLLHEYALRLLAQFREPRAGELVLRLARHPLADELLGDTVTVDLSRILASVLSDRPYRIYTLIEDEDADEFARVAGLHALGVLCRLGQIPRSDLSDYLGKLFAGIQAGEDSFVWTGLVDFCAVFGLAEHLAVCEAAMAEGLVDPDFDDWSDTERRLKSGQFDEAEDRYYRLIEDTAAEMSDWSCFDPEVFEDAKDEVDFDEEDGWADWEEEREHLGSLPPGPVRVDPKPGRNDPCSCGSGKKFKKCCG